MVEHFNRMLDMFATAVDDHPADWEVYIPQVVLCVQYEYSLFHKLKSFFFNDGPSGNHPY